MKRSLISSLQGFATTNNNVKKVNELALHSSMKKNSTIIDPITIIVLLVGLSYMDQGSADDTK